jgi:hypothetical protein
LCGCGIGLPDGPNRGEPRKFLNRAHKKTFEREAARIGAATLADKVHPLKPAIPRSRRASIRTLDDLSISEGLPPGCYPPGAIGRLKRKRSFVEGIPATQRLTLLLEAARRLGLTEEGPILTAARRAAQNLELRTSHHEATA